MLHKHNNKECYLCGAMATTRDHIPPVGLYPKPRPNNLITVPACSNCNYARSLDDEYFRLVIAAGSCDASQSKNILQQRITPRLRKTPALIIEFLKSVKKINLLDSSGNCVGKASIFQVDRPRVQAVIDKIVRGLYFKHTSHRLAPGYIVEDYIAYPEIERKLQDAITELPLVNIGDGSIFSYRFHISAANESESFWFLMFYNDTSLFITKTCITGDNLIKSPATAA